MYPFEPFKIIKIPQNNEDSKNVPMPRSGHRLVCYGVNVFSFGGYNPIVEYDDELFKQTRPLYLELWKFNTLTNKWKRMPHDDNIPIEVASHAAVSSGPHMVVFGGTGLELADPSNSVHLCHLPTGKWTLYETTGDAPDRGYGQGVLIDGDVMYVVGGTHGFTFNMDIHYLQFSKREWMFIKPSQDSTTKNCNPKPRYRHEIIKYDDKLIVFGGSQLERAFTLKKLPAFDLHRKTWFQIQTHPDHSSQSYPKNRKCHVLEHFDSYVYIHGGIEELDTYFADFWRIDLKTMTWFKFSVQTDTPLYFHSSALTKDGCMYMFGGVSDPDNEKRSNDIYKVWLNVAPLRHMCWDALSHSFPHLPKLNKESLRKLGIPHTIVTEL